jgi:Cu/Ag efflux pump CusA
MMRAIIDSSIKFRLLVLALAAGAIAIGITQLPKTSVEVLPDFTPTTVEVQTEALGLSAEEVEELITVPLEQDLLNGVAFLDDIRSESVPGLSRILMIFEEGTDLYTARQVVAERMTQAHALPNVSKPPQMLQPLSSTNRAMIVSIQSEKLTPLQLGVLARWTIGPRLVGVPGVANVAIWGQQDRQLQVQVNPERLRQNDVTLLNVVETAGNALWVSPLTFIEASTPGTGGFIDTPNQRLGVMHRSPVKSAEDLAKIRLEDVGGRNLSLGDVATVVEDHQPLIGDAVVEEGRGLMLVVEKFPNANALEVTRGIEEAIAAMSPGMAGVQFDSEVYRPATYIESSIDNLTVALIAGFLLIALVLGLLFRWRTALVGLIVIPVSLLIGALTLKFMGATMNAIVLAGLAAALILLVDDAVVDVDNITRKLREHRRAGGTDSTASVVMRALLGSRRAALYGLLVLGAAITPVFFLERLSGAFFPDLAAAYLVALVVSMVLALTLTPALAVLLFSKGRLDRDDLPLTRWAGGAYQAGLKRIVGTPRVAYAAVGIVIVGAAIAVPASMSNSLLPTFKESELLIRWDAKPGTSLPEMNRITGLVSGELREIDGVREVGAHVGRAVTGDKSLNVNSADLWVGIEEEADYGATVAAINRTVAAYPGLAGEVKTYSNDKVSQALSGRGERDDVVVRVFGEDLNVLETQANKVRQSMSGIEGIRDARFTVPVREPSLEIETNLAKAREFGIKPGDIRRSASSLLAGINVGSLFEEQKVFDIIVWGTPNVRQSVTSVRNLLIDTPDGGHVRLGQVADVRIKPNLTVINRESVSRYIDVVAGVNGRSRDAVVGDVDSALKGMAFPLEYHAEVLSADTQPTAKLVAIGVTAALVAFLLFQAFFGSWRLAALAFLTFPIPVAGALLATVPGGGDLSFGSYIALFAVFGLSVRSGLMLFDRFRELERDEAMPFGTELILRGARDRLLPMLATMLAGGLVFVPVLLMGSKAGYELVHPMAAPIIGGVVTTALLSLFVLPVLYLRFASAPAAEAAAEEEEAPEVAAVPELG